MLAHLTDQPAWSASPRAPPSHAHSHRTLRHRCDKMVFVQKFMMRKKSDTGARVNPVAPGVLPLIGCFRLRVRTCSNLHSRVE